MSTIDRRALEWLLLSNDTGSSSKELAMHMLGLPCRPYGPSDEGDLGRCLRLLDRFPEWKSRVGEMKRYGGCWEQYFDNWDRLLAAFERRDGSAGTMMRILREAARRADREGGA